MSATFVDNKDLPTIHNTKRLSKKNMYISKRFTLISLLIIACTNVPISTSKKLRGINKNSSIEDGERRRLVIDEDSVRTFKKSSPSDDDLNEVGNNVIPIEFISSSNHIIINNDKKYNLNELKQYSVLASDSRIFKNGEEIVDDGVKDGFVNDNSPLYMGKVDDNNEVKISVDENRRISVIHIIENNSAVTTYSSTENSNEEENDNEPQYFDFHHDHDHGHEHNVFTDNIDNPNITFFESSNYTKEHDAGFLFTTMSSSCSSYRTITVAIAFDTTFCNNVGYGSFQTSVSRVQSIVGLASSKYQQFCINLKVATVDGQCDYNKDPYKNMRLLTSGCMGYPGLLNDLRSYWDFTNKHLPGISVHLFTGSPFHDGPIGCSDIGSLCRGKAYGVNSMSYHSDPNYQAVLFAHELGHNLGATHTNAENYVMSARVGRADFGWDATNFNIIRNFLYYAFCF